MSGATPLDDAGRRLRMRSWRRGIREMDLILGPFADGNLPAMSMSTIAAYERALSENDHDLYRWVGGQEQAPAEHGQIIAVIRAFHGIA
jgi:antitoxin CptB